MALNLVNIKTIYAEDPKLEEKDVKSLVKWVQTQPHLPKIGDFEAILFLKKSGYRLGHAQTTIDTFFTLKNLWPDVFLERNFAKTPQQQGILDTMIMMVLPKRTPEGYAIIFMKPLSPNMINYKVETLYKYVYMACLLDVYQKGPANGHIIVYDIQHFPECFIPKMEYSFFKKFFYYDYEVIPIMQVKEMHIYNTNPRMDEVVAVFEATALKPVLPLIMVHESLDDLMKYVPKEYLPQDCGGLLEPVATLHGDIVCIFHFSEIQAILFIRRCNYQSETSKNLIDLYFTVKTLCPELLSGKDPLNSPVKEYLDVVLITDLSKTTPEDYTIIFGKITSANPSEFNISLGTKYLDMVTMSTIYQKPPSKGYLFVVDLTEFTLEVLANMDLIVLKKTLFYMQKCLLLNWKGIHFFNNAPIGNRFLGMLKPFLDEFQNIIHLHDSVDDLIKYVPRDCLPENYGGLEDSVSVLQEKIKTKLRENVALFDWDEEQKVDESKRSGGPKTVNDVFGVEGTFKKLELD